MPWKSKNSLIRKIQSFELVPSNFGTFILIERNTEESSIPPEKTSVGGEVVGGGGVEPGAGPNIPQTGEGEA